MAELVLFIDGHKPKGTPLSENFLSSVADTGRHFHTVFMDKGDRFHQRLYELGAFTDSRSLELHKNFISRYSGNHDLIDCARLIATNYPEVRQPQFTNDKDRALVAAVASPVRPAKTDQGEDHTQQKGRFNYSTQDVEGVVFEDLGFDARLASTKLPSEKQATLLMSLFKWLDQNYSNKDIPVNIPSAPAAKQRVIKMFGSSFDNRHDQFRKMGVLGEEGFFVFTKEFVKIFNSKKKRGELVQWSKDYQAYRTVLAQQRYGGAVAERQL